MDLLWKASAQRTSHARIAKTRRRAQRSVAKEQRDAACCLQDDLAEPADATAKL